MLTHLPVQPKSDIYKEGRSVVLQNSIIYFPLPYTTTQTINQHVYLQAFRGELPPYSLTHISPLNIPYHSRLFRAVLTSQHDGLKQDGTPDKRVSSEHGFGGS